MRGLKLKRERKKNNNNNNGVNLQLTRCPKIILITWRVEEINL